MRRSGEALLTVINDILDFSKIETGKLQIENIKFSIRTIVDDVVALLAGSAQGNGLALMASVDDSVPSVSRETRAVCARCSPTSSETPSSSPRRGRSCVRVTATGHARAATHVRFELTDTGVGIAPGKLATIFDPFAQADTSTTRGYGGTGLGLAISSQLDCLDGG